MPSAFIPFCSFGSILEGRHVQNISFPVCDLFNPVVLDGKLCYQMDMARKMPEATTVQGKGLTLIIDANFERSVANQVKHDGNKNPKRLDLQEASLEVV